jgi:uncharacterized protein
MIYLWATLLCAVNLGFLGLTAMTLPGNWLMVGLTAAVAWWQWDQQMISPAVLVVIVVLAGVGELLEMFSSSVLVRRSGGSKRAGRGALLGGLAGALLGTFLIPVPLFGSMLGAAAGAACGAMVFERRGGRAMRESGRSGMAAGTGWLLGGVLKFVAGVAIWLTVAVSAYWP